MILSELDILLFIITISLLAIASWQDIRTREISDWVWIVMIVGGILIHSLNLMLRILIEENPNKYFSTWILNIFFAICLALFLTFSGLGGEADRIAFIAIAVNSPIFQPPFVFSDPQYEILVVYTPRILSTFFNAYLLAIPVPFLIFAYNFINQYPYPEFYNLPNESKWTRFLIRFIGYPRHTEDLKKKMKKNPWHFDFLEEFQEKNGWQISFRVRLDKPEIDLNRKEEIISHAQSKEKISIWVQPSLPFIFILMLGYIADFIVGNILFGVLFLIFKSM